MKILVVGSSGVLGRHVIPRLIERGHNVRAIIRKAEQAPFLELIGAEPFPGDILDRDSLEKAAEGCQAALHLATAIPKSPDQGWDVNDRIRREGSANLLAAAEKNGLQRYIQQSVIYVYGDNGHSRIDEAAPLNPVPVVQSAVDMEKMVEASALGWCILRGGMFYGPLTGMEAGWRQAALENRLQYPGDGSDMLSLVRVMDMARAVVLATESSITGKIYNIVDDEAVSYKALFEYICSQISVKGPLPGGKKYLPSLNCSNARAKKELAWQPVYPGYRSGLV